MKSTLSAIAAAAALVLCTSAGASEHRLDLDPAQTAVHFKVTATGHDVEGSFHVTVGEVRFDPEAGTATGEIRVDALSAETGNGSRDKTLKNDVLETARYPLFVFKPERLAGAVPESGDGDVELRGQVTLHGASHPLTLPAHVHIEGDRLALTADFAVPYVEWGLHNPSILFLKVADVVQVRIEGSGVLSTAGGSETAVHGR